MDCSGNIVAAARFYTLKRHALFGHGVFAVRPPWAGSNG